MFFFARKDEKDCVVPLMMVHEFSKSVYNSEKGRRIREGGRTRSSNHDRDPRLARGTDQGPSSVCEGLWRAWLNLIIVVSLTYTHKSIRVRARGEMHALARIHVRTSEPRVGSAKSQQLTHYSRWTQHSHLVRDVGVVIFNTSRRSGSSCQRLRLRLYGDYTLKIEADGGWVPLVGS